MAPSPNVTRRDRAITHSVAASAMAKAFAVGCTFVQVPIALHYLGTEAYGLWMTLVTLITVLNTVDFGLGVGMQHGMAQSFGSDDLERMKRIFWTGVTVLCLLGVAVLAIGLPLAFLVDWADAMHIKDSALRLQTGAALAIAIAAFVAGLPFNAVARLCFAAQRGWIQSGWIAAGNAIALGLVAAAAFGRWGYLWFLAASLLVPFVQGTGLFIHLLLGLGWSLRPTGLASAADVRHMLRSSFLVALPQFGQTLIQSAPALAISMAAGSSAVTGYSLLLRLFSPFHQGQVLLLTPVWPAYTEAHARDDHAWVGLTFRRTIAAYVLLAAGLVVAAWQSPLLFRIWIGRGAPGIGPKLTLLCAIWWILQMTAQPFIYYLMGVGQLRRLAFAATPGLFLTALALFWGLGKGTVNGVLEAGSATLAVAVLPPLIWATLRTLRRHEEIVPAR